jgi:hypothetical protein
MPHNKTIVKKVVRMINARFAHSFATSSPAYGQSDGSLASMLAT